jgi:hypothetical protein
MRGEKSGSKRKRPSPEKITENAKIVKSIRRKYLPEFRLLGKELYEIGNKLLDLDSKVHEEAIKLTGDEDYDNDNIASFQEFGGSMEYQQEHLEVCGPGFVDVRNLGDNLVYLKERSDSEEESADHASSSD